MKERILTFVRSPHFWGSIIGILAIVVIAFAYFYPDASQGNLLRQHDMQQGAAIGQEALAYQQATGETSRWTNSLFSGMPTFQISPSYPSSALFSWLNTVMGLGLPSPANLLAMMMLGFFIMGLCMRMRWYVALMGAVAYGFSSYFIIIIGAGHIWKFITLAYVPPTIGGIIMAYRGRYLAGSAIAALFAMLQIAGNHVQMTYYFLFVILGLMIAYLVAAIRSHEVRRWWIATASLAVAAILAVGANLPSLYNTYEYSKETMRGNHSELTSPHSAEQATAGGLDRDYITQYSYGRAETFTLLIPNIKGGATIRPEKGSNRMLTLADLPEAQRMAQEGKIDRMQSQYLQWLGQYFGEPEATNGPVYVGAVIFALFLLGCFVVRGPVKWALLILTLFSILLALGRNCMWLTDLMIDYMPMYSKFRTVESILVIAEFTMPLLGMMALQQILTADREKAWQLYGKKLCWCFGVVMAVCLAAVIIPSVFGPTVTDADRSTDAYIQEMLMSQGATQQQAYSLSLANPQIFSAVSHLRESMITADGMRSFLIVGFGFILLFLYLRRKLTGSIAAGLLCLLVLGDLYLADKRYLNTDSFISPVVAGPEPFPMSETDRQILADTTSHYRVMNIPQFWQADPSYRHKTIGGYHAAKLTRYQDLIDRHLGNFVQGNPSDADMRVLDMLNARYIVDNSGQPFINDGALGNAWFVDTLELVNGANAEMDALQTLNPRTQAVADKAFADILGKVQPSAPGDTIRLTSYAPNRLTYSANSAKGGLAVFSEVYFPWGWTATVDGNEVPIGRVNYLLRAMQIPAGHHTVVMTFDPKSIHTTVAIADTSIILIYLAILAAIGCAVAGRGCCRRKKEGAGQQ
ncbi:MAG: YfhO family protein [Muribaculaceae bacterium]|nr:YfhO family protein [Muribaculaceae bacterium]